MHERFDSREEQHLNLHVPLLEEVDVFRPSNRQFSKFWWDPLLPKVIGERNQITCYITKLKLGMDTNTMEVYIKYLRNLEI